MLFLETKGGDLVADSADGSGTIILRVPQPCACGRVAAFLKNRDGKTRCVVCDIKYQEEKLAPGRDKF